MADEDKAEDNAGDKAADKADAGRWDVGAKDGTVYVERRNADDEQVFTDRLTPEDARRLGQLLTKFADKAGAGDDSD